MISSTYFDIQTLSRGVYAAIVKPGTGAQGNAGIVNLGDYTVVFDTFLTPNAAQALRETAEQLTGNKVKYVVNSHRHADHVCGNQVFPDSVIIATEQTREAMQRAYQTILSDSSVITSHIEALKNQRDQTIDEKTVEALTAEISDHQAFQSQLNNTVLCLPTLTFKDRLIIHGSHRKVELITFGGGHTDSDTFMLIPEERIAFMGDLITVRAHPSIISANVDEWIRILEMVQELEIRTVVPGHGTVGTMDDVAATERYLSNLLKIDDGVFDNANNMLPQSFSDWMMPHVFEWNVRSLRNRSLSRESKSCRSR